MEMNIGFDALTEMTIGEILEIEKEVSKEWIYKQQKNRLVLQRH